MPLPRAPCMPAYNLGHCTQFRFVHLDTRLLIIILFHRLGKPNPGIPLDDRISMYSRELKRRLLGAA